MRRRCFTFFNRDILLQKLGESNALGKWFEKDPAAKYQHLRSVAWFYVKENAVIDCESYGDVPSRGARCIPSFVAAGQSVPFAFTV